MSKWIGRVATLIWDHPKVGEFQPKQRVRIIETEEATRFMDSNNIDGYWYFARYEDGGK